MAMSGKFNLVVKYNKNTSLANYYARSINTCLVECFDEYLCELPKDKKSNFRAILLERTHKGWFEDFFDTLSEYTFDELLELVIPEKIKRLQKKNKLLIKLSKEYETIILDEESPSNGIVTYVFLVKKTHLDFANNIKYSKEDNCFITTHKETKQKWKFRYEKTTEIDDFELPCIIRLF